MDRHLSPETFVRTRRDRRNVNRYGPPQRYDRFGFLDAERHLLAHTEDEIWLGCDLQELDAYVCGDD